MDSYCLICGKSIRYNSTLLSLYYVSDCLCETCRDKIPLRRKNIMINHHRVEGLFVYEGLLKECLIQYKEMNDEALASMFLFKYAYYIYYKYRDYILVPVPSSKESIEKRGFKHVNKMFEITGLPIVELFQKDADVNQKKANYAQRQKISEHIVLTKEIDKSQKILIVDDVLTTGASMKACFKLLENYENVSGLCISYNEIYLQRKNKRIK